MSGAASASKPFIGVAQAARLIAQGQASSVELTTDFLARAKANESLGAFLHLDAEGALAQARQADAASAAPLRGVLSGVPIAHKDIFATAEPPDEPPGTREASQGLRAGK